MEKDKPSVGYEIHILDNMIGRRVSTYQTKFCDHEDLSQMQSWILGYLYMHRDTDVFQKDIEAQFHIARSTATGILQIMEKKELIIRKAHHHDSRLKCLIPTEKGIKIHLTIVNRIEHMEEILKKDISPERLGTFFDVLHQIRHNLESDELK